MEVTCGTMRIVHEVLLLAAVLMQRGNQTDPPDTLQNLFCVRLDRDSAVNCTWSPSNETLIPNEYIFLYGKEGSSKLTSCTTSTPSLILERKDLSAGLVYVAWVKAKTTLGEESSAPLKFIIDDIVKPHPPATVTGKPVPDNPTVIQVTWTNPTNLDSSVGLQCELQYRVAGDTYWTEISHDEIGIQATEYELESLQPFTMYEFQLQCGRQGETNRRLWSDWSAVSSGRTREDCPVGGLDVWFVQQPPDLRGLRPVTLLWKPLEEHQANGIIQIYSVSQRDGEEMREENITSCCNISLSGTTRSVTVTAYNSIGATQPAELNLVQDQPAPWNISVHTNNHSILVSWEPPVNKTPEGFVVEWNNMDTPQQPPDWKKIPSANASVTLRDGVLYPRHPYKVSVYARYQDGLGGPVSTLVYTEEGAPLIGPHVSISNISQTQVTLLWKAIPLGLRQGFVLYYTLYYVKNPGGDTRHEARNISYTLHSHTLMDLEPRSTYTIWMTASTKVGEGTKGPNLKFTTQASQIVIWKILLLVFVFLVIVAICILFGRCYYQLRTQSLTSIFLPQWCFQKIPDPGNSRAGLQQHHYMPGVLGMMENEPVIVEVEETAPEDKVQVPLINSNSPTLAGDRGSEDPYWTSAPSQGVDNSQEASMHLDQCLADQSFITKLPGGTCFISGYEKHFMPSPEDLLADEWQFDSKEECLGMGDTMTFNPQDT